MLTSLPPGRRSHAKPRSIVSPRSSLPRAGQGLYRSTPLREWTYRGLRARQCLRRTRTDLTPLGVSFQDSIGHLARQSRAPQHTVHNVCVVTCLMVRTQCGRMPQEDRNETARLSDNQRGSRTIRRQPHQLHRLVRQGRLRTAKDPRDERVTLLNTEDIESELGFSGEEGDDMAYTYTTGGAERLTLT